MDKTLKDKWITALRSGQYKQGRCSLRKEDEYCCLGVLCDLIDNSSWKINEDYEDNIYNYMDCEKECLCSLSFDLLDKVGLSEEDENVLIRMNDTQKEPFPVIADYIEKYL